MRMGLELVLGIELSCRWEGSGDNVVDRVPVGLGLEMRPRLSVWMGRC